MQIDTGTIFDVIIAGAGPAGCVLASRLSEEGSRRILLIEAGPDVAPGAEHPDILDPFALSATTNPAFQWRGLVAEDGVDPGDGSARAIRPFLQASCLGGGSNINGMAADRGQPGDYDLWEQMGAAGWGWAGVLPYFKKLEHDLDFTGCGASSTHGCDGPMPVRRLARSRWAPFAGAIGDALQRRGFPYVEDYNSDFREGFSSVPTNCLFDRRMSASMAYLTRDVRRRTNLTILTNAKVRRLSLAGRHVDGVFVNIDDRLLMIGARQVIVSCGALQSPTLLMRSGIGPSKHLVEQGIEVGRHLAGVGANLQNHPCVTLTAYLPREAAQTRENVWFAQNWLRFSSEQPGCERNDMHLLVFNKCAWHGLGARVGALVVSVLNSYSKGTVHLSSTEDPQIQFNFLADTRDFERLVTGLRLALRLLVDAGVERMRREIFLPNPDIVGSLARRNTWNRLRASAITLALDRASLRRRLFAHARIDPERLLADTDALRDFVRRHASMQLHVCGTCRLGAADDPDAVVDGSGKVHGIAGLRVADASIFPTVPRGYTHFPVIMAAEKIADAVRAEWGSRSEDMQSRSVLTQEVHIRSPRASSWYWNTLKWTNILARIE